MKFKLSYIGKDLKDVYPYATKSQTRRFRFNKIMEKILIVILGLGFVGGAFYGTFQAGRITTKSYPVYAAQSEVDVSDVRFETKIDSLKNRIIDQLKACESAGHKEEDGIIIFDTNSKASIGQFQFQVDTVIHYYKTLYGKDITKKEAVMIALDSTKAAQLTKDIMFTTKNMAGKDWVNCSNKYNLDSQIDLIKSIE